MKQPELAQVVMGGKRLKSFSCQLVAVTRLQAHSNHASASSSGMRGKHSKAVRLEQFSTSIPAAFNGSTIVAVNLRNLSNGDEHECGSVSRKCRGPLCVPMSYPSSRIRFAPRCTATLMAAVPEL